MWTFWDLEYIPKPNMICVFRDGPCLESNYAFFGIRFLYFLSVLEHVFIHSTTYSTSSEVLNEAHWSSADLSMAKFGKTQRIKATRASVPPP